MTKKATTEEVDNTGKCLFVIHELLLRLIEKGYSPREVSSAVLHSAIDISFHIFQNDPVRLRREVNEMITNWLQIHNKNINEQPTTTEWDI